MSNEQIIRDAISRSISHTEIFHVEINGDSGEILELISSTMPDHWDYTISDYEGVDRMDAYSLEESRDQWRINIVFKEEPSE